ncbi:MAG TPA: beta-propeller domain-containing protein [Acidimicrobiia bacterium]|nr:beta-propeller domain-containing protein [Acidimicrobiia bacterium]
MRRTALVGLFGLMLAACSPAVIEDPEEPAPDPTSPVIVGSAFQTFSNCDDLLEYYISEAVDIVGPYGLGGPIWMFGERTAVDTAAAEDSAGSGGGADRSFTESNNQVTGVDEIDIVKTDGNRIYTIVDGTLRVGTVGDPGITIAGSLSFRDWWPQGILLEGNTVLAVGQIWGGDVTPLASDSRIAPGYSTSITRIAQIDVTDASNPRIVRTLDMDGSFVSARNVDGSIRVALNSNPVGLEFVMPAGGGLRAEREATEANRQIVRNSTLDNWLPYFVLTDANGSTSEGQLLDCNTVMAPNTFAGIDTLSLLTFDLNTGIGAWGDAGVVASGATMYATADSTYLATQRWMNWGIMTDAESADAAEGFTTQIHKFDTASGVPRYVASGEVKGFLLNQFAMDEYAGDLRVASTTSPGDWWFSDESESRVTVLRPSGQTLAEIGLVDGLGLTERIFAVRFMGPTGYVVTFRQTDPLYVVDLSDPAAPAVVGELKIPGYSAYLHPVGDGRLLGVGQDADEDGRVLGTQISLFDVSDPANPLRIDQITMESGWSQAEGNHLAFTFVDGTALAPYERWSWELIDDTGKERSTFDAGVLAVRVAGDSLSLAGVLRTELDSAVVLEGDEDWGRVDPWRMVPQRTIVIDGYVYSITYGGIAIHNLDTLTRITFQRF